MEKKSTKYIETIGRRKTSTARVRVTPASKLSVVVNDKPLATYFMTKELETIVKSPFAESEAGDKFEVTALVKGGGIHSQAEAVRHGIARALVEMNEEERGKQNAEDAPTHHGEKERTRPAAAQWQL